MQRVIPATLMVELNKLGSCMLKLREHAEQARELCLKIFEIGRIEGFTDNEIRGIIKQELTNKGIQSDRAFRKYLPQELKNQNMARNKENLTSSNLRHGMPQKLNLITEEQELAGNPKLGLEIEAADGARNDVAREPVEFMALWQELYWLLHKLRDPNEYYLKILLNPDTEEIYGIQMEDDRGNIIDTFLKRGYVIESSTKRDGVDN